MRVSEATPGLGNSLLFGFKGGGWPVCVKLIRVVALAGMHAEAMEEGTRATLVTTLMG